ncbi:kinase-like domain-containing protein [Lactarius quietus]|nr:kinase-like domain-containing protein [Lactarius quietus]
MQPPSRDGFPFHHDPDSLIAETLVSVITKAVITSDDGEQQVVAVKEGKAKKNLVLEPHDIIKELLGMFTRAQIIRVLGHEYDAPLSSQRFWMPFMPFTLSDLLSVPTFSPIPDPDAPHSTESGMAFEVVARSIVYQILSGVAYLHSPERRVAHRDIKPRNILLDTSGTAVLVDFGVAYSSAVGPRDVWPEPEGKMYFEVGSGPYRAPELLFGARKYDAMACDLWSLGATFAEFFTTLHRRAIPDDDTTWATRKRATLQRHIYLISCPTRGRPLNGNVILYSTVRVVTSVSHGAFSAFAAHQHQKTGPFVTFSDLPDANKINFVDSPGVPLSTLLPHLGSLHGPSAHEPPADQESTAVDLLQRLLIYPPTSRFSAEGALSHPWLLSSGPIVLPWAALTAVTATENATEMRGGRTAAEWLKHNCCFPRPRLV